MNNLYLFSFIPVIGLSIAMMLGIHNKSEYGNRWKYLTLSIIFLIVLSIISIITIGNPSIDSKIDASILIFALLLYSLSLFYLEYSVHIQRIKLSYLEEDVNIPLKKYKLFIILTFISLVINILTSIIKPNSKVYAFVVIASLLLVVLNLYIVTSVFNFKKGVLRKKNYPFIIMTSISVVYIGIILNIFLNGIDILYYPLILINIVYLVRCYEEYVYFRTKHMQLVLDSQHKSRKESAKLINKIILSNKEEDSNIIESIIDNMLANMKRELVMESNGITGIMTYRLYNGVFRIDSDNMINGYCTPISVMLSIKKVAIDNIHKKLLDTKFELDYILNTPIEELHEFGEKYLKMIIEKKEIIEMEEIPSCYKGLQKLIAFVPIFNEDKIAGFQVVFKDNYNKLYYFEKKQLKTQGFNLNTIFSIINGKQVQEDRNRLIGEMNIAKEIQTSIVPKTMELDGYTITCDMLTATEVGGDAYDFIKNKFGNYFSIGDVSGHGLPSGITALIFLASLQAALETAQELDKKLDVDIAYDIVNRVLCKINRDRIGSDKFMTGNIFREENGTLYYAGAHEVAVQYSSKEDRVIHHTGCTERTAFLGLSEFIKSYTSKGEFEMSSGDILILYTDGVIEAKDENGIQYGVENVDALLYENKEKSPEEILTLLKNEVISYAKKGDIKKNDGALSDDISMVIIKKN